MTIIHRVNSDQLAPGYECLPRSGVSAMVGIAALQVSGQGQPQSQPTPEAAADCAVTQPLRDRPPNQPGADPFGVGPWYVNADRTMWAGWDAVRMVADSPGHERGNKVLWIRPTGTQLEVIGRRLDGEAAPMRAHIPCCYPSGFQASGLSFPIAGCWEIRAKAGDAALTFVTRVR